MSNVLYRSFAAKALRAACGFGAPVAEGQIYCYAVDSAFGFNPMHSVLDDLPVGCVGSKSVPLIQELDDDGQLKITTQVNLFADAPVTGMIGLVFTVEWMDGDVAKNSLIAFVDTWDESVTPVTTTEWLKLSFTHRFVFRLGSVAEIV